MTAITPSSAPATGGRRLVSPRTRGQYGSRPTDPPQERSPRSRILRRLYIAKGALVLALVAGMGASLGLLRTNAQLERQLAQAESLLRGVRGPASYSPVWDTSGGAPNESGGAGP